MLASDVDAFLAQEVASIRLPANGSSRCSSSIRRMSRRSTSLTGFGR